MYLQSTLMGALVGSAGTAVGGLLAIAIGQRRADLPRLLMAFAGGVMSAVVFFDLFIESAKMSGVIIMCIGAAAGGIFMALLSPAFVKDHSMASVGILVLIGIALHNLPEGLAVGSSLAASPDFAISLSLLMMLHNVPEGLAVCLPLRISGMPAAKMLFLSLLTGLPTALGALIGTAVGSISPYMIAACLAFAGGAMLYISLKELIPAAGAKKRTLPALIGACVGIILTSLI
jgi:ZIP family zinc transporter